MNKQQLIAIWTNGCRFLLAAVFLFSGFVKANDPMGTVYKIQDYFEAWSLYGWMEGWLPYWVAWTMAVVEFTLGIYLLFGIRRRVSTTAVLMLMVLMTPLTLWLAIANPISDCGCFGDAWVLTNWETFWKNVILTIAAITVFKWKERLFSLVTGKVDWLISLYSFVYIIFFIFYTLHFLPVFDFRPYQVGVNIAQGMTIPPGMKPTVYDTQFIYAKDGVEKTFDINHLPTDSAWIFVDSKTVIKEKGYEPPIHDFSITSVTDGEDLTDTILRAKGYTFLLVSPWLEKADDSAMDQINAVYDFTQEFGYRFWCVTASTEKEMKRWQDLTGAEYGFAMMDGITLKTMIRSNPGLILIRDGIIVNKWSDNNLPSEDQLTLPLDRNPIGKSHEKSFRRKMVDVIMLFILPLVGLTLIDQSWEGWKRRRRKKKEQDMMNN